MRSSLIVHLSFCSLLFTLPCLTAEEYDPEVEPMYMEHSDYFDMHALVPLPSTMLRKVLLECKWAFAGLLQALPLFTNYSPYMRCLCHSVMLGCLYFNNMESRELIGRSTFCSFVIMLAGLLYPHPNNTNNMPIGLGLLTVITMLVQYFTRSAIFPRHLAIRLFVLPMVIAVAMNFFMPIHGAFDDSEIVFSNVWAASFLVTLLPLLLEDN